jgi:hypothetical protein
MKNLREMKQHYVPDICTVSAALIRSGIYLCLCDNCLTYQETGREGAIAFLARHYPHGMHHVIDVPMSGDFDAVRMDGFRTFRNSREAAAGLGTANGMLLAEPEEIVAAACANGEAYGHRWALPNRIVMDGRETFSCDKAAADAMKRNENSKANAGNIARAASRGNGVAYGHRWEWAL